MASPRYVPIHVRAERLTKYMLKWKEQHGSAVVNLAIDNYRAETLAEALEDKQIADRLDKLVEKKK